MDQNAAFAEFWKILDDLHDYEDEGYRQPHPAPPEFKVRLVKSREEKELHPIQLEQIQETRGEVENCRACDLHLARKAAILGEGNLKASLMLVLPPPGYEADDQGIPIAGEHRDFLQKWIQALGLDWEKDCYITNVVKCRPPGNRPPFPEELRACNVYLRDQVDTLRPSVLLLLGPSSLSLIDQDPSQFESLRGKPLQGPADLVLCTYDPYWVLEHPQLKRPVWEDLKLVKDFFLHG